jgi:hypothetical protein
MLLHERLARGGHRFPKVSLGLAMPYASNTLKVVSEVVARRAGGLQPSSIPLDTPQCMPLCHYKFNVTIKYMFMFNLVSLLSWSLALRYRGYQILMWKISESDLQNEKLTKYWNWTSGKLNKWQVGLQNSKFSQINQLTCKLANCLQIALQNGKFLCELTLEWQSDWKNSKIDLQNGKLPCELTCKMANCLANWPAKWQIAWQIDLQNGKLPGELTCKMES